MTHMTKFCLVLVAFFFSQFTFACDAGDDDVGVPAQFDANGNLIMVHQFYQTTYTNGAVDCAVFLPGVKTEQTRTTPSPMFFADQGTTWSGVIYTSGIMTGFNAYGEGTICYSTT